MKTKQVLFINSIVFIAFIVISYILGNVVILKSIFIFMLLLIPQFIIIKINKSILRIFLISIFISLLIFSIGTVSSRIFLFFSDIFQFLIITMLQVFLHFIFIIGGIFIYRKYLLGVKKLKISSDCIFMFVLSIIFFMISLLIEIYTLSSPNFNIDEMTMINILEIMNYSSKWYFVLLDNLSLAALSSSLMILINKNIKSL